MTRVKNTNKIISTPFIAEKMFAHWTQENFFKYLRQEYDLDKIVHYIVNDIDSDFQVVNPIHSILTNQLKKLREKIARRKAELYELVNVNLEENSDKTGKNLVRQSIIQNS